MTADDNEPTCLECGKPYQPPAKFCTGCGKPLKGGFALGQKSVRSAKRTTAPLRDGPPADGEATLIHLGGAERRATHSLSHDFVVGRTEGNLVVADDVFLSRRHLAIRKRDGSFVLSDLGSRNGTFVKIDETEVDAGVQVQIGAQLLQLRAITSDTAEVLLLNGDVPDDVIAEFSDEIVLGRSSNDGRFRSDELLSELHLKIRRDHADRFRLIDLDTRTGSYVRIATDWPLGDDDVFTAGRQVFTLSLSPVEPAYS